MTPIILGRTRAHQAQIDKARKWAHGRKRGEPKPPLSLTIGDTAIQQVSCCNGKCHEHMTYDDIAEVFSVGWTRSAKPYKWYWLCPKCAKEGA